MPDLMLGVQSLSSPENLFYSSHLQPVLSLTWNSLLCLHSFLINSSVDL